MKVAVLLSGGVDSSVAMHLARKAGTTAITAFYLKIWLEDELAFLGECPWEEDLKFARAVCGQAGINLEVISLQQEYHERVVSHALGELKRGRTPSPDILCNEHIKFGLFFDKIGGGFDKIVSGHYARISVEAGWHLLKRSADAIKDQTYFLSRLNQEQLKRLWFPIGHLTKAEVRRTADELGLPNRDRKDSQGICFLGKIQYNDFVRYHLGEKKGEIVAIDSSKVLGQHNGVWFYTIGQREGLGLAGGPWYVVKKDLAPNIVYVTHREHRAAYGRNELTISDLHWIAEEPHRTDLQTKLRHSPLLENCRIQSLPGKRCAVTLENPDFGVAPGQSAILYDQDVCLGGGVIE